MSWQNQKLPIRLPLVQDPDVELVLIAASSLVPLSGALIKNSSETNAAIFSVIDRIVFSSTLKLEVLSDLGHKVIDHQVCLDTDRWLCALAMNSLSPERSAKPRPCPCRGAPWKDNFPSLQTRPDGASKRAGVVWRGRSPGLFRWNPEVVLDQGELISKRSHPTLNQAILENKTSGTASLVPLRFR